MQRDRTPNDVGRELAPLIELPEPECLLTVIDVADMLKLPLTWVYERTRRRGPGRLPGFKIGAYWRYRRDEVLAWIGEQQAASTRCSA